MFKIKYLFVCLFAFVTTIARAQIKLPNVIGSNMVLQRNQPVPVWGWATAGKTVKVSFGKQTKTTRADTAGYWKVTLNALTANSKPQGMIITSDTSTVKLTNILVGEVWLCSGQSNMEYTMKLMKGYTKPYKGIDSTEAELTAANPNIRLFKVEKK